MIAALFAGLTLAIWLYLLLARGMFWRLREREFAPMTGVAGRVAIVIPARNEAGVIGRTIASLARQDYSGAFHIFLVDDHSEDGTAEAASVAPPVILTVIRAEPLSAGWTGKLWALAGGLREAERFRPDYVLFSDADIVHAPDNLSKLVAAAESHDYDLVSFMVKLPCETIAEKALIPAFVFFFFMLYPPAWTANPRRKTAGAAGGCILLRWSAISRIGGIGAIRGELIDDCALAKAVKAAGGKLWLGVTSSTTSIRRYSTFREIGRMISRTAFWQLSHSTWLLLGTVVAMLVTYVLPPLLLVTVRPPAAASGGLAWCLMMAAYIPALRFHHRSILWAPFLPLVALFYVGATIHSAVRYWRGCGGVWKGRVQDRKKSG